MISGRSLLLCDRIVMTSHPRTQSWIQQKHNKKALDDELVAPENRLKIGKSNLRLSSNLKSKEPTLQVALDALKLTSFYNAFEITADVPKIYMQEFWVTVSRHHSSLHFKLNGKSHTVNVDNFRDMLKICPKLPGPKFEEPPLEEEILSFIRDLGHTGEIKFLSDVNGNHMHQPWRSFAAIINKCLSGKTTALESLCLSRAQILWGMYHNRRLCLLAMGRFGDTQVYGAILPQHLTNQAMLESEAYMTYRAYATGEKTPKPKSTKKKADSESSPKTKPTQASKGKRIKTSAKGDKAAKMKQSTTKSKGLTVLYEVALSEAEQIKLATKRSKKEFHSSHASGSGDGVDIQSKVPDEQQHTVSGTNEGAGEDDEENDEHDSENDNDEHDSENDNDDEDDDQEIVNGEPELDDDGDDFVYPNLSTYKADDQEEEKEDEKANDDDEVSFDHKVSTPPDYELTEEEENQEDDDTEEVHVTLTTEPPVVQKQSSSVSSDLVSKFINPSPDTGIDWILNPNVQSDSPVNVSVSATTEIPSSDTTIPQPPIPIIQSQQQTHDSTTTPIPTTTLPEIPNFASLFGFERRVSSLETELSELKQTNQFAEALSSILGIVDNYLASKMKDAVNVAVQAQSNKPQKEAQAENDEFLKQIDSNSKAIIKDQVKAQVSKIMPKVESKCHINSIAEVLARSSNQPQHLKLQHITLRIRDLFASYGDVVTLKRGCDDQQKDEEPSAGSNRGTKRRRSGKEESSKEATQKESKSTSSSKGAPDLNQNHQASLHKQRSMALKHLIVEMEQTKTVEDKPPQSWMTQLAQASGTQSSFNEFLATPIDFSAFIMNQLKLNNLTQDVLTGPTYDPGQEFEEPPLEEDILSLLETLDTLRFYGYATNMETLKDVYSRHMIIAVTSLKIMEFFGYKDLEEITVRRQDDQLSRFREGDFKRLLLVQERVEDLQLAVESYQKKRNLLRPDSYRLDLRKMTRYTAYHNIQGIIYQDDMDINRLMRTDELYKFSDDTLNHVCTALNDIATGIQMEY
ncbi:hypothetical protein Tco_0845775 [Tanacetum coccineum]